MESGSVGKVTTEAADDQWQNITRRRANTAQAKDGHKTQRRPVHRRLAFRKPSLKDRNEDSTPTMVADFVFRKQVEWLVDNAGVSDNYKSVAQSIWFSYLSHYMVDLKDGVEKTLGGDDMWHQAYPLGDTAALLTCTRRELRGKLKALEQHKPALERIYRFTHTNLGMKAVKMTDTFTALQLTNHIKSFCFCRPTAALLLAVHSLTLHICQEDIVLSDLLRWVRLRKLPLLDMSAYKASASPAELRSLRLNRGFGNYASYEKKALWLATVLKGKSITTLPNLPVAPLVQRFIEELNLPFEMIPFVLSLLERINSLAYQLESVSTSPIPSGYIRGKNVESHVMSCIFYALRILFVLDDACENRLSEATLRIQLLLPSSQFFDFQLWYQHLMHRRALLFKHTVLSRSVRSFSTYLQSMGLDRLSKRPNDSRISPFGHGDRYNQLTQAFNRTQQTSTSLSFLVDLAPTVRPYRAHTEALSEYYPELAVDFSQHTIKHLLQDQSWTKDLGVTGESVRVETTAIRQVRLQGYNRTQPVRLCLNGHGARSTLVEAQDLTYVTRHLIRTMADMIDHPVIFLVGCIVNLELAFFPKHPSCRNTGSSRNIKHLKTV